MRENKPKERRRQVMSGNLTWVILGGLVLAIILVPFFLFEDPLNAWSEALLHHARKQGILAALMIVLALAADVFLPIPSSMVSTGAGLAFGLYVGAMLSFAGMTLGSIVGYAFGRLSRRAVRWIGPDQMKQLEDFFARYGNWSVVAARPIPVLAEASVVFAGMSRMPFGLFLGEVSLANLGISLVYAAVGAFAFSVQSFFLALAGAMLLPLLVRLIMLAIRKRWPARPA